MAENTTITATTRTEFGKGAARRIRRAHQIPAVLYGHGAAPIHLTLPGHATMLAVKAANAVLEIDLEGTAHLALVKDVQRDPIKPVIEHIDLVAIKRGEKVTVDVPVTVVGDTAPETVLNLDLTALSVEAEAMHIPEAIEIDVQGMAAGEQVLASQVGLPDGASLAIDPDTLVLNVSAAITAEALEAELADAEAEAGIEKDESDAEGAAAEGDAQE